jgi:hypothetical protein
MMKRRQEARFEVFTAVKIQVAVFWVVTQALKVKVKLSLRLTKHHAMKTYWGVEVYLHAFLTLELNGGEWSASLPGRFTPW